MRIPTVDYFLCCLSLETGAVILGWFGAFAGLVGLIVTTILFGGSVFDYPLLVSNTNLSPCEKDVLLEVKFCKLRTT
jgi:hypothetical protein